MDRDINQLTEYIVCLLSDLIKQKERQEIKPCTVSMTEIQNTLVSDAKQAINGLCKEQVLTFHKTLNDVSFEFTPSK